MVRLEENKKFSEGKPIEKLPLPKVVYIPLAQHLGKPCEPLVKPGDMVYLGQKIGSIDAKLYAPVHASVSGKVLAIQDWPHPVLGRALAIAIENDGKDQSGELGARSQEEVDKLTAQEIREIVFAAGIVGMGGASFPTHIKLNPPKAVESLIINGAECEPYLTSDSQLMVEKTAQIIKGIELVKKCVRAKEAIVAIEENKPEAIKKFTELSNSEFSVRVLKSEYPQGGEKQLMQNVLGKEIPRGKLPFDIGASVQNVATVFAIYEAVYLGKPLYERVVTVTGPSVANPKNLLVRIGTRVLDVIAFCGLKQEPAKIIAGGPMMGIAQYTDQVPIIKSTNGILLLDKEQTRDVEEVFCSRCGNCVRACPVGLLPTLINLSCKKKNWPSAKFYGALDCIECGLCSYVCPSNINLVQSIKRAKMEIPK